MRSACKALFLVNAVVVGSTVSSSFTLTRASAQVSAALSGTIADQTGASVAQAKVTARSAGEGVERTTFTDSAGRYELRLLGVGTYQIEVEKAGFSQDVRTGVHLVVGQDAVVDFRLHVGAVSDQVTVNSDAPVVNPTTADISGLVGSQQIKDLPLNGRSPLTRAWLITPPPR